MYTIIGADQREYGPVSEEQIAQWIAQGRADARTRARAGEGGEWKPLSEFPEFAAALAARRSLARTAPPPKIGAADVERMAAEILTRDYRLDIGDCFSRSWKLVRQDFWVLVGGTAVAVVLSSLLGFVPVLGVPAAVVLAFVLQGGVHWMFLQRLRGKPADIGAVFAGFSLAFVPLLLAGVVAHVLIGLGFLLLLLPGIYLLVAWRMFVPLLIIDRGLEFWPAMELSRKVVTRHWWLCFGFFLLAWLVGFLGLLACGVGIFLTMPISAGALVCAYEDIFGKAEQEQLPATTAGPGLSSEIPSAPAPAPAPASASAPAAPAEVGPAAVAAPADANPAASAPADSGPPAGAPG